MKKTVFLSGPMRGIDRAEGLAWRKKATELLKNNFHLKHAYRGREDKETFTDYRSAVIRDKYDILRSDLVLVCDTFDNVSMVGTAMEVLLAFQKNIPVIIFGHSHEKDYFLNFHSQARYPTLDEACQMINSMFKD